MIISIFSVLPSSITYALEDLGLFSLVWISIVIAVILGLFALLIFKSDKVVSVLKLDKGFEDEKIDFGNLKSTDLIKTGIFIIGGMLFLDNIPVFLSHAYFAFKENIVGTPYPPKEKFYWAVSGINLVIGYLLLTNYHHISKKLHFTQGKK
jgi:hypothetical protein